MWWSVCVWPLEAHVRQICTMLKGGRSSQRRQEKTLPNNEASSGQRGKASSRFKKWLREKYPRVYGFFFSETPFYIHHFFGLLVSLGFLGGFLALTVPLWKSWAEIPYIGFIGSFLSSFIPPSDADKYPDGKVITDLRQHILYITGGIIAILTLLQTNWKNQGDRLKIDADIKKNEEDVKKSERDHVRQVHAERRSRYSKAVEQLANEKAAVRLGGIYTLVSLVDEWLTDDTLSPEERQKEGQVIINNLCSYVRSPFPHTELRELFEKNNSEENIPGDIRDEILQKQALFREEQDIRSTILTETINRLSNKRDNSEAEKKIPKKGPWSDFSYNFSGTHFLYNVDFRNIVINSRINFSHSIFGQVISFYNSIFEGEVFFGGSKFEKTSSFINVAFKKSSLFHEAEFKSGVSFQKSTFNDSAIFHSTLFRSTASFASTHFKEKADFKDVNFTGHTIFSRAIFEKEAIFTDANFNKIISPRANPSDATADFNGATFEKLADFRGAYFEGFANFSEANFESDADFISITFNEFDGFIDFTDATFISSAKFINSTFFGSMGFYGARFINKEPRFAFPSSSILMARFSCSVTPESYIFGASSLSPYKIQLGQSEINGKKFIVPEGTILFDPKSWDEEKQKYTRVSEPAKPLENSDTRAEKPAE